MLITVTPQYAQRILARPRWRSIDVVWFPPGL
jgi:hypothetical protein